MKQVTIDKGNFRKIVEENKADHEKEFHEASAAFYENFNEQLRIVSDCVADQTANYAEAMKSLNGLNCPQGYCDQYQEVLDQLEYEVGETITLSAEEFAQYVKDEWHWKHAFAASYHVNTGKTVEISKMATPVPLTS